jgi:hypothetical protein
MTKARLHNTFCPLTHWLAKIASTIGNTATTSTSVFPANSASFRCKPVKYTDFYINDFIELAQGTLQVWENVHNVLMHAINEVFQPQTLGKTKHCQEPILVKELLQGDSNWAMQKTVLGWVLNTATQTLTLPQQCFA